MKGRARGLLHIKQCLHSVKMWTCIFSFFSEEVRIDYNDDTGYLVNTKTGSQPVIAHGNGPIKVIQKRQDHDNLWLNCA